MHVVVYARVGVGMHMVNVHIAVYGECMYRVRQFTTVDLVKYADKCDVGCGCRVLPLWSRANNAAYTLHGKVAAMLVHRSL